MKEEFGRIELLLGEEDMKKLNAAHVIIFGVGGVGSWCAESLVRSGITHLTIVDQDVVSRTNINRQLMATTKTVGMRKVDVLRDRLLEINPDAEINAIFQTYSKETAHEFRLETYDVVIDAIDSLKDKAALIMHACQLSAEKQQAEFTEDGVSARLTLLSSMGAALRIDPTKVRVAEFWKVRNDTLGRALRKKFKHNNEKPAVKFQCVYSEELPMENKGTIDPDDTCSYKAQINGSLAHITGIFGFTLAGLAMQAIVSHTSGNL